VELIRLEAALKTSVEDLVSLIKEAREEARAPLGQEELADIPLRKFSDKEAAIIAEWKLKGSPVP
jgi:hypothetical protein